MCDWSINIAKQTEGAFDGARCISENFMQVMAWFKVAGVSATAELK